MITDTSVLAQSLTFIKNKIRKASFFAQDNTVSDVKQQHYINTRDRVGFPRVDHLDARLEN